MGQSNEQEYQNRTSGNPPHNQSGGDQQQKESDDAYFAGQRERQDPEATDLGGGEGDFRHMQTDNQPAETQNRDEQ